MTERVTDMTDAQRAQLTTADQRRVWGEMYTAYLQAKDAYLAAYSVWAHNQTAHNRKLLNKAASAYDFAGHVIARDIAAPLLAEREALVGMLTQASAVAEKFVVKVESGRARSNETYAECKALLTDIAALLADGVDGEGGAE